MKVTKPLKLGLIEDIEDKCSCCGKDLYITDDLINLYCDDNMCIENIQGRVEKYGIKVDNNNKSASMLIVEKEKPKDFVELVEKCNMYLLSKWAKELFTGFNNVEQTIKGLSNQEISKRLGDNSDWTGEVVKQFEKYYKELLEVEGLIM